MNFNVSRLAVARVSFVEKHEVAELCARVSVCGCVSACVGLGGNEVLAHVRIHYNQMTTTCAIVVKLRCVGVRVVGEGGLGRRRRYVTVKFLTVIAARLMCGPKSMR